MLAKLFGWFKRWNAKVVEPMVEDPKVRLVGGTPMLTIRPEDITVYAVSIAIGELVHRGSISSGVANKLEARCNELIDVLSQGKPVFRDHDGIYRTEPVAANPKVLTLGDDEDDG